MRCINICIVLTHVMVIIQCNTKLNKNVVALSKDVNDVRTELNSTLKSEKSIDNTTMGNSIRSGRGASGIDEVAPMRDSLPTSLLRLQKRGNDSISGILLKEKQHLKPKTYINLEQYMKNMTRVIGSKVSFYCDILGQPIPMFQWFRNERKISESSNRIRIETGLWGSSLRVDQIKKSDEGTYVCMATNPSGTVNATATLRVIEKAQNEQSTQAPTIKGQPTDPTLLSDGFCQEFHSNVCGKFLIGHKVYVTREYQQALMETQISKFLKLAAMQPLQRIREDCLKHLIEAACYYNFPVCIPVHGTEVGGSDTPADSLGDTYRPVHLCRQDCHAVMENECSATYRQLERTIMHEVPEMVLNCPSLPAFTYDRSSTCRSLGQPLPIFFQGNEYENGKSETHSLQDFSPNDELKKPTSADNKNVYLPEVAPPTPDLIPLFIAVGVLLLLGFLFIIFCFFCRRGWKNTPRSRTDSQRLFSRRSKGFGRLNGTHGIPTLNKQDDFTPNDFVMDRKSHGSTKTSYTKEGGYTSAYSPRSNILVSHSNSSNNLLVSPVCNGVNSLSSGLNSQTAMGSDRTHLVGSPGGDMRNGSAVTYHQYQPQVCMLPPLPPPSAPAPPPPQSDFQLINQNSRAANGTTSPQYGSNGNSSDTPVPNRGLYELKGSTESPTAYTTLRDSGSNGYMMSHSSVSMIRLNGNICDGVAYSRADLSESCAPNLTEYSLTQLRFGKQFGQGVFGPVYKAELIHTNAYQNDSTTTQVIVKTLSAGSPASLQADFRREAELISELDHPNVLSLFGVCLQNPPWCMIFEVNQYMDLCELLMTKRVSDVTTTGSDNYGAQPVSLSDAEKLYILGQVAAGMDYLSSHRFVHRDLAARNVLVLNEQLFCKITDLGLARDCYASDYYRTHPHSLMLPIRWMPLDSILYGKFTVESDIWAFGVLMWELWSGGMRPYSQFSDSEVLELIRARQLLHIPARCPTEVYAFMLSCWAEELEKRPSFKDCLYQISRWQYNTRSPGAHGIATSCSSPVSFAQTSRHVAENEYNCVLNERDIDSHDRQNIHELVPFSYFSKENPPVFVSGGTVWLDTFAGGTTAASQQAGRSPNFPMARYSSLMNSKEKVTKDGADLVPIPTTAITPFNPNERIQSCTSTHAAGLDADLLRRSTAIYTPTIDSVL